MRDVLTASAVALLAASAASADVLWNNGPLSTGPVSSDGVAAPDGTSWSETHGGTIGWAASDRSNGSRFRILDDFTVPAGQTWTIDAVHVFSYFTDVPADVSPVRSATLQIWSGTPGGDGSVIYGDDETNVMTGSIFSGVYRAELNFVEPQRPIWDTTLGTTSLTLTEGTYWIDWNTIWNVGHTAYAVPTAGDPTNANAMQYYYHGDTGEVTYSPLIDSGNALAQEIPFIIEGTVTPAPATLPLCGLLGMTLMRRRRTA